jgi:hypothetical protein
MPAVIRTGTCCDEQVGAILSLAAGDAFDVAAAQALSPYPRYRSASTNKANAAEGCRRLGYQM